MKATLSAFLITGASLLLPLEVWGQSSLGWQATALDGCSTRYEATELVTNVTTGAVTNRNHSYVSVSSGLNYLDESGRWVPSREVIELTSDGGAAALHGPTKVHFNANLNTAGAITFFTVSNRVVRAHPLCLAYYDAASGKAVVLSKLKDCTGELLPPNQVVYRGAFDGADVRYTWTKAAFESDVILLQQPPDPRSCGMDPKTTRLEVWHEWLDAAAPRISARVLAREPDPVLALGMADPSFVDQLLDFGDMWLPTGAAYATDGSAERSAHTPAQINVPSLGREPGLVPIAKTWITAANRTFLIESVRFGDLSPELAKLPAPAGTHSPFAAPEDRTACLDQLPVPSSPEPGDPPVHVASSEYSPRGCLLDYIEVTGYQDYTFSAGTYYVGPTYFQGTVTIQSEAVLKYQKDAGRLLCYGAFVFTSGGIPAILTSEDDDSAGLPLPWSTGCPSCAADVALWDYYQPAAVDIHGVRIYWAKTAVQLDANADPNDPYGCSGLTHSFWDSNVQFCQTGIYANNGIVNVYYAGECGVLRPIAIAPSPAGCTAVNDGFTHTTCSASSPIAWSSPVQACKNSPTDITLTGSAGTCAGPLAFEIVDPPNHGQLGDVYPLTEMTAGLTYTPTAGFCGQDSFSYRVSDCGGISAPVQVTIFVGDPHPVAKPQDIFALKGQPTQIQLSGSDICSDTLNFSISTGAAQGSLGPLTQSPPNHAFLMYTPTSADFEGPDTFQFVASNCGYTSDPATILINVISAPVLRTECRRDRIVLFWTVPEWLVAEYGNAFFWDFKIYRCESSSGSCTPTEVYATVEDTGTRIYVDRGVQAGKSYCYRVTFRHADRFDPLVIHESPFSNTECNECCLPPPAATDVAFILDNTSSIGAETLVQLRGEIATFLDDLEILSGGDYRLALVTPDNDQVNVRLAFSPNNRLAFDAVLNNIPELDGYGPPESTDECLNTVINALSALGRLNPEGCQRNALQINDFMPPFRNSSDVRRVIVLLTDAPPGGFCDDFVRGIDDLRAHNYALMARGNNCIRINSIQAAHEAGTFDPDAETVLKDYATTSCGWYSQVPHSGRGVSECVSTLLYVPGACNCP